MGTPAIEVTGKMTGLTRKLDETGEVIRFTITTKKIEAWNRLIAHAEGDVAVSLVPQQPELEMGNGKDGKPRGVKEGSQADSGAHGAQD